MSIGTQWHYSGHIDPDSQTLGSNVPYLFDHDGARSDRERSSPPLSAFGWMGFGFVSSSSCFDSECATQKRTSRKSFKCDCELVPRWRLNCSPPP